MNVCVVCNKPIAENETLIVWLGDKFHLGCYRATLKDSDKWNPKPREYRSEPQRRDRHPDPPPWE